MQTMYNYINLWQIRWIHPESQVNVANKLDAHMEKEHTVQLGK